MSDWRATPCQVWTGGCYPNGYGKSGTTEFGTRLAHRIAWIRVNGRLPPETPFVLHRCDNRPCINVAHLFAGSQRDNIRDMHMKGRARNGSEGRTHCKSGHELTEQNTYVNPRGARRCRCCKALDDRRRRQANPEKYRAACRASYHRNKIAVSM